MSYKQIILSIRGYENKQIRDWERARLIAYEVYVSIPKKKGNSNMPIHSFMPLPSDQDRKRGLTKEKTKELRQFFIDKQKNKLNEN